jgi:hypothetical protein
VFMYEFVPILRHRPLANSPKPLTLLVGGRSARIENRIHCRYTVRRQPGVTYSGPRAWRPEPKRIRKRGSKLRRAVSACRRSAKIATGRVWIAVNACDSSAVDRIIPNCRCTILYRDLLSTFDHSSVFVKSIKLRSIQNRSRMWFEIHAGEPLVGVNYKQLRCALYGCCAGISEWRTRELARTQSGD